MPQSDLYRLSVTRRYCECPLQQTRFLDFYSANVIPCDIKLFHPFELSAHLVALLLRDSWHKLTSMNPAIVPPSAPPPPLPRSMPITLFVVKYDPYPMWNPFARKPLANPPRNISPLTKDRPRSDYRQSS